MAMSSQGHAPRATSLPPPTSSNSPTPRRSASFEAFGRKPSCSAPELLNTASDAHKIDTPSEPPKTPVKKAGNMHHIVWKFRSIFGDYDTMWPNPPQIKDIRAVMEPFLGKLGLGNNPQIEFLSSGSFHQAFKISRDRGCNLQQQTEEDGSEASACPSFVFRASLPACPFYKTASEVATMSYVRQHTSIPVPRAYAYDTSSDNAVGHEWILMEMIEGASTFADAEDDMSWEQKLQLSRQVADWTHQLSQLCFNSIGSLYFEDDLPVQRQNSTSNDGVTFLATAKIPRSGPVLIDQAGPLVYCLGPVVGNIFNSDWRPEYDFNRGPYRSVAAFIDAVLDMHRLEVNDMRQRARSEMSEAMDNAYGSFKEDKAIKQARLDRTEAEWRIKTEARIGGPLDPRVNWTLDTPYSVRDDGDFDEFEHATEDAAHLKRALEGAPFDMTRQDLTADPSSCRLFAWDMSCFNVLVDSNTKEPLAVIDWEQIIFMPPYLIDFYPKVLTGPGSDGQNDDFSEPSRPDYDERQAQYYEDRFYNYDAKLLREEFRDRLFSLDPTALDMYEARWAEFRPSNEETESDDELECPDSEPSTSMPNKPRTSLPLDLWSIAAPGTHTERRVDPMEAATPRSQSHPAALEAVSGSDGKGKETDPLRRQRKVEAVLRETIGYLWAPVHHSWRKLGELYSDLGYEEPEN